MPLKTVNNKKQYDGVLKIMIKKYNTENIILYV